MNFSKTKHGDSLLRELYNQKAPISIETLENRLNISRRSIFYTIKQLNKELKAKNIDEIENIRKSGYTLSPKAKNYFLTHTTKAQQISSFNELNRNIFHFPNLSKEERILITKYFLISRPYTSLNQLSVIFNISKNTVIADLQIIRHDFSKKFTIENKRKGKIVVGKEKEKRKWIFSNLNSVLKILNNNFSFSFSPKYLQQLCLLERITGNTFTDDSRILLAYFMQWEIERIKISNLSIQITLNRTSSSDSSLIYIWAQSFFNDEDIHNSYETQFLAEVVTTQSFQQINTKDPLLNRLIPVTQQIIDEFTNLTNIELPKEIGEHNLKYMLASHLVSTYYRAKYHISYRNPLLNQIKSSYRATFEITKAALSPLKDITGIQLSDDEIALITIYFSGALRSLQIGQSKQKSQIAVVCSSGIGTSRLLLMQLTQRYPTLNFIGPLNMIEFENLSKTNIQLVLSTTKLSSPSNNFPPIIQIPPLPNTADWLNLDSYLRKNQLIKSSNNSINIVTIMDIISNYARIVEPKNLENALNSYIYKSSGNQNHSLNSYFSDWQFTDQKMNWKEAVSFSLDNLLKNSIIEEKYIEKIIELTEDRGDYMVLGNGVFLAHATPQSGVQQLGVSFTYFKKQFCIFNEDKPINFVIGLAPIDQKSHLKILSNLLRCIQNKDWITKLNSVSNSNDLYQLLIEGHLI